MDTAWASTEISPVKSHNNIFFNVSHMNYGSVFDLLFACLVKKKFYNWKTCSKDVDVIAKIGSSWCIPCVMVIFYNWKFWLNNVSAKANSFLLYVLLDIFLQLEILTGQRLSKWQYLTHSTLYRNLSPTEKIG